MNKVNKFELKLIRENNMKKETLSIRASFKIFENSLTIIRNRKIQSNQIGFFYNLNLPYKIWGNLEILVQELCKYLKS